MPSTTHPGLDLDAVHDYLAEHVDGAGSGPLEARLLANGRSNISYVLEQGSRRLVLRRPPLGNILPSAHDMGREFRVLSGLGRVGFPAPAAVALCEDADLIGAPFMVMAFVEGRVIATAAEAATLTPPAACAISDSLVDTLAALHLLDPREAQLDTLGRPEGYLARQLTRWSEQWQRTKTRELVEVDALQSWLVKRMPGVPGSLPSGLVHGDFRIDNVILGAGDRIDAVLDWEMSTLGDPVSDLAISLVYWNERTDVLRAELPVSEHVTDGAGFATRAELVERYARLTGFDLGHLDVCLVLACFKLAVIMESIHKRTLAGDQLGAGSAESMGAAPLALARLGLEVAAGGGVAALGR